MPTLLRVLVIWVVAASLARPILVGHANPDRSTFAAEGSSKDCVTLWPSGAIDAVNMFFRTRLFCGRRGIFVGPHLSRTCMPMEFRACSAFNLIQSANIMCTSYSCPDEHAYAHAFLFREGRQWRLFGTRPLLARQCPGATHRVRRASFFADWLEEV